MTGRERRDDQSVHLGCVIENGVKPRQQVTILVPPPRVSVRVPIFPTVFEGLQVLRRSSMWSHESTTQLDFTPSAPPTLAMVGCFDRQQLPDHDFMINRIDVVQ